MRRQVVDRIAPPIYALVDFLVIMAPAVAIELAGTAAGMPGDSMDLVATSFLIGGVHAIVAWSRLLEEERVAVRRLDMWIAAIDSIVVLALSATALILLVLVVFVDEHSWMADRGYPVFVLWGGIQLAAVAVAELTGRFVFWWLEPHEQRTERRARRRTLIQTLKEPGMTTPAETSPSSALQTRPLSPALGVEVTALDLRDPVEPEVMDELVRLFDRHHLLLFRQQELTNADQVRVAGWFGPTLDESTDGSGATLVSNRDPAGRIREGRLLFHSDLAFTPEPILAISLYAIEVPTDGAPTLFANAVRAAANLPNELRSQLADKEALHVFDLRDSRGDRRFRLAELPDSAPRSVHPVLLPHPRTGVPVLYVSEMQTDSIVGVDPALGEQLLDSAKRVLLTSDNVYEHRWQPGDLVVWDNVALLHARGDITEAGTRTLRRVPVGTRAVTLQR